MLYYLNSQYSISKQNNLLSTNKPIKDNRLSEYRFLQEPMVVLSV